VPTAGFINQIVVAELAPAFDRLPTSMGRLPAETFHREELPFDAAFLLAERLQPTVRRGGPRTSPIADFYWRPRRRRRLPLLTRDQQWYALTFPHLSLIAPK